MFSTKMSTAAACSCGVYHEMCAVMRTFGCSYSQCPAGSGSGSTVSSVAIATTSSSSATRSASWSTSDPRAMLTRCTPGVICANAAASIRWRVRAVAGAASTTCAAPGNNSSSECTICTPGTGLGVSVRRKARTCIPNACARDATAAPIPPRPTSASVAPSTRSSAGRGKFQYLGGCERNVSGNRFAHARTAAMTHSEMGTALAPRAEVTMRSLVKTPAATLSTPVPESCTQRTPAASSQRDDLVPARVTTEERVGLQPRGRITTGEFDELDVGIRIGDPRRFERSDTELGDDPHNGGTYRIPRTENPAIRWQRNRSHESKTLPSDGRKTGVTRRFSCQRGVVRGRRRRGDPAYAARRCSRRSSRGAFRSPKVRCGARMGLSS